MTMQAWSPDPGGTNNGRGEIFRKSRQKAQTYFCTSPLKFTIFIVSFARKMI